MFCTSSIRWYASWRSMRERDVDRHIVMINDAHPNPPKDSRWTFTSTIPRLPPGTAQHFPPASGRFLAFPFRQQPHQNKMFRSALPRVSRALPHNAPAAKRFLTTAPPHKTSRSWKNSAARWTLAGGLIYYYNTSSVFAEEPVCTSHSLQLRLENPP